MLQKDNRYKVLKVFLDNSIGKFGLREISRKINLGLPSVKRYLSEFVQEGLVVKENYRGNPVYSSERDSERFRFYMKLFMEYELFESGIIDFLWKELSPEAIIFYGGFQKGEATEKSDIDLFVVGKNKGNQKINLKKYEKLLGKEIHLIVDELRNIPKELKNNLSNGVVMRGYVKFFS